MLVQAGSSLARERSRHTQRERQQDRRWNERVGRGSSSKEIVESDPSSLAHIIRPWGYVSLYSNSLLRMRSTGKYQAGDRRDRMGPMKDWTDRRSKWERGEFSTVRSRLHLSVKHGGEA